jgi:hypothetical protein
VRFNLLLADAGIEPHQTAVAFHTPSEPPLRRALPWLAQERPDLFDAYQNNHARNAEATVRGRRWMASFVAGEGRDMIFAGLFRVDGHVRRDREGFEADPAHRELARVAGLDAAAWAARYEEAGRLVFTLHRADDLSDLVGRLVVERPQARTFMRRAETLDDLSIIELARESRLVLPLPDWRDVALLGPQLRALPHSWALRLAEWRGIYVIVDEVDGARYIGAAYGNQNLLGRWRMHVAGEQGVTAQLRHRNPATFRFSILERVSPDMPAEEVIRLEQTWMDRLHTRRFGLNAGGPPLAERTGNA